MKFPKNKQRNKKFLNFKKDGNMEKSSKEVPRCYRCNKTRHIKVDFHLLQNKKKNCHHKQLMKATWSDDSNSSSSDDEDHVANMCFMAIKSDNDVLSLDDEYDLSYDELHDEFESLYDGFKKLGHKYSSLKKQLCMFTC